MVRITGLPVSKMVQETQLHTHTHLFNGPFPGLPRWAGTRKVKPVWILLKQETVSGSGISWAICNSAPRSRQITMPATHHSKFFYRPDALPAAQPTASKHWRHNSSMNMTHMTRQSTEGKEETQLQWKTNRKSYVVYQLAPIPMTLNDAEGHWHITYYFKRYILCSCWIFGMISTDKACCHSPSALADLLVTAVVTKLHMGHPHYYWIVILHARWNLDQFCHFAQLTRV